MKKIIFTAVLAMSFITIGAQNDSGDVTLAPQLGVNFSTYASEATYDSRTSFSAGVIGEYYFSDRWSLRSGILYDPKGAEDGGNNVDKINYITIPLNANWHFGRNRNWYLNFGFGVSFVANAETDLSNNTTIDIKNFISGTDFGLMLGIGYKFDISDTTQLYIDYQGYGGFTNVDEANNLPYDVRNSRSSINLGVVFVL